MSDRNGVRHGEWVSVFQARNYAEAGMVRGLLEAEGMLVNLQSLLGVPHLGFSGQVMVMVPHAEELPALRLISAYFSHPAPVNGDEQEEDKR